MPYNVSYEIQPEEDVCECHIYGTEVIHDDGSRTPIDPAEVQDEIWEWIDDQEGAALALAEDLVDRFDR